MPVTTAKLVEPLPRIQLPAHEILEGTPDPGGQFTAYTADGRGSAGFWSCGTGRYEFYFDYDEFIYIVHGEMRVTDKATGATYALVDGDTAHFPSGVTTIWEITRPLTKYFVSIGGGESGS